MVIFGLFTGFSLERSSLRFLPAFLFFIFMLFAGRGLAFFVFTVQQRVTASPEADFLFYYFDSTFIPMFLPAVFIWIFTFLSRRNSSFIPWECGIITVLFAGLFWSQAEFDITVYPHPGFLGFAAIIFIFLQVFILAETVTLKRAERHQEIRRGYRLFYWILVPVLLLFLLFMFNWYSTEAVSHGGGLIKPTFFRFDFSRYIQLESEISLDDDLVMLVRKENGYDANLLRRFVLSGYRRREGFFSRSGTRQ